MANKITACLDKTNQVIRAELAGSFDLNDTREITRLIDQQVAGLDDPQDIRISLDCRQLGRATPEARKSLTGILKEKPVTRFAMWGMPAHIRIFLRIFLQTLGLDVIRIFNTEQDAPGLLVLTDLYDDDWQVTVDGRSADMLRANFALRAVCVPDGAHTVRFAYRPRSYLIGRVVSGVGWLAMIVGGIGWVGWSWWNRR